MSVDCHLETGAGIQDRFARHSFEMLSVGGGWGDKTLFFRFLVTPRFFKVETVIGKNEQRDISESKYIPVVKYHGSRGPN